jgi:hypothetical protein
MYPDLPGMVQCVARLGTGTTSPYEIVRHHNFIAISQAHDWEICNEDIVSQDRHDLHGLRKQLP